MRAIVEKIDTHGMESFLVQRFTVPGFSFLWHLHPEMELTLILSGQGRRLVGDSMEPFAAGDLVLLGKNLPHTWSSEPRRNEGLMRHTAVVIQFQEHAFGHDFFKLPELRAVRRLLDDAARGIVFRGAIRKRAQTQMLALLKQSPAQRLILLLEILAKLAAARPAERNLLASPGFATEVDRPGERRIAEVCRWVNENFQRRLRLTDAAARAHVSLSAFNRIFQKATGKTFTQYVNEVRIANSCRLLLDTDESVAQIAYASGFSNLSHFNRRFLRNKTLSPRDFRKAYAAPQSAQR